MKEFECVKKYSGVRGFAYFAPKGCNGIGQWVYEFDEKVFAMVL